MRKAFRRAAALVAASSLAGAAPALAQTSPYQTNPPTARATTTGPASRPAVPAPTTHAAADPSARLAEIQVEVAWLADPVTFPFALSAHALGSSLELRGSVPNEVVRSHAVQVAREHSSLTVADGLAVQRDLHVSPPVVESSEAVARGAAAVLRETETLGRYASTFEVRAQSQGLVILKGPIPSFEEKRLASERLRHLRGCTAIDNQLEVLTVHHQGKAFVAVSADGSQLAPYDTKSPHPAPSVVASTPPVHSPYPAPAAVPQKVAAAPVVTTPAVRKMADRPPAPTAPSNYGISRVAYVSGNSGGTAAVAPEPPAHPATAPAPMTRPAAPMTAVAPHTPAPAVFAPEALLRQRIQLACGDSARDVEILAHSPTSFVIRMRVHDAMTGDRLGHRILAMPELQPYQVNLELQIVP